MTTVAEIDAYRGWPSAEWWDYSHIAEECARHTGYAVVNAGDRLDRTAQLKPAMYLRGMEQFLMDLTLEPALAEAIIEHITDLLPGVQPACVRGRPRHRHLHDGRRLRHAERTHD